VAWKFLDEVLAEHHLTQLPLSLLEPDCAEFDVLLYQHGGGIVADENGVSNVDADSATARFNSLFALAEKVRPQLLVTPEYSCPWSVIEQETHSDRWPATGSAWIVGCESIRLAELQQLADRCRDAIWLLPRCMPERGQVFLDCVCIFVRAQDIHGNDVRVLAIQAKGCAMADGRHLIEPRSLILGMDRYVLRNDSDSIHLVVFVCSDALEQGILTSIPHHENFPYLVIHTQLNPDPRNPSFREYRDIWGTHDMERIEILCLNRAKGTTILGVATPFGGSGWYYKSSAVDVNDADVNGAHSAGAYYTENHTRYFHCHLLNYSEHVFHLRSRKISQVRSAAPTRLLRKGPIGVAAYSWDAHTLSWEIDSPDDGFADACRLIGNDLSPLTDPSMSPANKERLACLSSGAIARSSKAKWPSLRTLPSFKITSDEVCQRITFCHDPDAQSRETRRLILQAFSTLRNEILSGTVPFPSHLELLQTQGTIRYPVDNCSLSFNVAGPNGEFPATFVFLGDASETHAKERMADLADIIEDAKRTLVVWFRENGQLRYVYPEGMSNFDADLNESVRSIVGETHL
jgi:hypothetical protein